jgi:hypothetical protein
MPEAKVVLESTALVSTPFQSAAGFDPYQIDQDASSFAFSIQFGATQYNRWKLSFPQAQVVAIAPQVVDGVACMELTIRGYCSTPVAADDISVLFD